MYMYEHFAILRFYFITPFITYVREVSFLV